MVETAILRIAYSNEIFFGKMIALGVDWPLFYMQA
jgi:hypothetical protein